MSDELQFVVRRLAKLHGHPIARVGNHDKLKFVGHSSPQFQRRETQQCKQDCKNQKSKDYL
jgi:hypothetical protein